VTSNHLWLSVTAASRVARAAVSVSCSIQQFKLRHVTTWAAGVVLIICRLKVSSDIGRVAGRVGGLSC